MSDFRYLGYAQEIIFGPGALRQLGEASARLGWQRLMLCTGGSAQRSGYVAQAGEALQGRLVSVYDAVQPHVLEAQVAEASDQAAANEVTAVIGLGGGSAIGMAKAISHVLEERLAGRLGRAELPADQPRVAVVAIPTTYAGSEMTAVFGVTRRQADGSTVKVTIGDPQIAPRLVLYDPLLTLSLPPAMTAATGINALAHCIEALYSISGHPLSAAAAASGLSRIHSALPRCFAAGDDREARSEMLIGAHLAGASLASATMGLHHGLCHVLGGTAGVPHGIANSIILPHAMRHNADAAAPAPPAPHWGLTAAGAMGLATVGLSGPAAAAAAADHVYELIGRLKLPQRLREAGVAEADLPALARQAFQSRTVQNNPKPIAAPSEIEQVLRAAW